MLPKGTVKKERGVNYDETFSPTASRLRVVIQKAVQEHLFFFIRWIAASDMNELNGVKEMLMSKI